MANETNYQLTLVKCDTEHRKRAFDTRISN